MEQFGDRMYGRTEWNSLEAECTVGQNGTVWGRMYGRTEWNSLEAECTVGQNGTVWGQNVR